MQNNYTKICKLKNRIYFEGHTRKSIYIVRGASRLFASLRRRKNFLNYFARDTDNELLIDLRYVTREYIYVCRTCNIPRQEERYKQKKSKQKFVGPVQKLELDYF